jgi:hypothetical protein
MNMERGFRRIAALISVILLLLGATFIAMVFPPPATLEDWLSSLGLVVILSAIPWGVFYLIRWLVRGFAGGSSVSTEERRHTRFPESWRERCAGLALLVIALAVAYYFVFFLPHERYARLEMERQERLEVEQRERAKLEMERQAEEAAEKAIDERLSKGRIWQIMQLKAVGPRPGTDTNEWVNVDASLRTSWRDGRLYYRLALAPFTMRELLKVGGDYVRLSDLHFFVLLLDSSGFKMKEIDVPKTSLFLILDTYQRPHEIQANESMPFSRSDYLKIGGWSLRWGY